MHKCSLLVSKNGVSGYLLFAISPFNQQITCSKTPGTCSGIILFQLSSWVFVVFKLQKTVIESFLHSRFLSDSLYAHIQSLFVLLLYFFFLSFYIYFLSLVINFRCGDNIRLSPLNRMERMTHPQITFRENFLVMLKGVIVMSRLPKRGFMRRRL